MVGVSEEEAAYRELLQLAEASTFQAPPEDDDDSDDRLAALQDGERLLFRAMRARPHDMQPRVMLLRNLMLQDGGREADVPALALRALTRLAESEGDDIVFGPAFVPAMQLVLLSLKSHWKLNQQSEIPTFLAAAAALVPTMQRDFEQLATRVESQLECCNPEGRAVLLASHRYLSNIDLQFVNGQHHQGSRGLESVDLLEEGTCAVGFG